MQYKYKLSGQDGKIVKYANEISYISWKSNGTFHALAMFPSEGLSVALDLEYGVGSTHITDQITKVLEHSGSYVKFETKDGVYEISPCVDEKVSLKIDKTEEKVKVEADKKESGKKDK